MKTARNTQVVDNPEQRTDLAWFDRIRSTKL